MNTELHVVIASELNEFGGGCESWLKYFLSQGLLNNGYFQHVNIYHISPAEAENSIATDLQKYPKYSFFAFKPDHPLAGNGIRTILQFTRYCLRQMEFPSTSSHVVLLIGSVYMAILGILLNYRYIFRKNVQIIPWIRSISAQEIAGDDAKKKVISQLLERSLLSICSQIIVNGQDTLVSYRSLYPRLAGKMRVVENAVDYKTFCGYGTPDWNRDKIRCAYMGRFVPAKGFDDFLRSVEKFDRADGKIEFHIYGHGELENEIPAGITNHGPYYPAEAKDILADLDVIVFLNKTGVAAGLSHGLLEAMAAGRLIIAWNNPIHCQVLDEQNAILLEEGNISMLADTYRLIASGAIDASVLREKCEAVRIKTQEYSVERHVGKFTQVVDELLGNGN